ncbi:MAG: type I methionyl aminopeptidase [Verrucomicrobia bacterium]|nr:type I methionyl aminopeptidase [Verrucomicrobiota bacterium]
MISIKTERETQAIRRSCVLAANLLVRVMQWIEPGRSVREIDEHAGALMKAEGARSPFLGYKGFPGHTCISINEEVVHGTPRDRKVQYGDIVSLDLGVIYEGWVGDTAETIAVGVVDAETRRLLEATEKSLYLAIDKARPGLRLSDVSHAVEAFVHANGFSVVREFVGHGVGRTLHEEPQIPNYGPPGKGPKLKPGMTLAIEPMINYGDSRVEVLADGWTVVTADRKPSAHFEHTVLITRDGPEILTIPDGKSGEIARKLSEARNSERKTTP